MPDRPKDDVPPAGYIAPGAMTEFLTDDWGFFIRTARQYERFTATVGVGDAVPTTMTLTYTLIGAGKKLASGSVVAGQSTKINVSVEGVYRLRFMINVPDPTNSAGCSPTFPQVVFGDAQVLGP